ncbi:restriction endonuclease subunit S [Rummeliibacillus sp. G93]|uniref:restriction endonuclease subunit S n=1 Tax=Rummeliibacillus sp. G93 TaxID=2939494 RepID=UPI00201C98CF|nr:restriction endonuclease subunit S [Rummeliibacillus sp. G93]UQW98830.1 restriction endonuclease subunit S [Rummeliibacillus sp. G93]
MTFRTHIKDVAILKNGKKRIKKSSGTYELYGANGKIGYTDEFLLEKESIVIGRVGANCGSIHYSKKPIWISDNTIGVIPKENVDGYYLYYYLKSLRLNERASGSAQPLINQSIINSIDLNLINISEQRKVGAFLKFLDDKIETNEQLIVNLEEIFQTLFKHWFIDFEFPNEQGQPYKSSGGEMIESELGMIPLKWRVSLLKDDTAYLSGGTPKTKEVSYWNGTIPFFTPKDAKSSIYTTTTEKKITELGLEKCNSKLYPKNTIFITARGTVGKLALANKPMAMNQSCFALQHNENHQFYLFGIVRNLVNQIILSANGAVFNAINLNDLKILKYVKPLQQIIKQFEEMVSPMFEKMSLLEEEILTLKELRNTLLPKLLLGKIEIPDDLVGELIV